MLEPFPDDWQSMLVLMPHPDDPEYGMSAAVAKWTGAGKTVGYVMATRGEAGIEGMPPEETGRVREAEQRRAAAIVGVTDVSFWDFPDSQIRDCAELRARIAETLIQTQPDVVVTIFDGLEWAPGAPNQRDHIEFSAAVRAAYRQLTEPPWLFANGPHGTHVETVDGFLGLAVDALSAHERYLSVLNPDTPVVEQARKQVEASTAPHPDFGGHRAVEFILIEKRPRTRRAAD